MMKITEEKKNLVAIEVWGTLTADDYQKIVPALEKKIAEDGKLRALIHIDDFEGMKADAIMEDLDFDLRHNDDFDRIAMVGGETLMEITTKLSKPFFSGEVRHFDKGEMAKAWQWLES